MINIFQKFKDGLKKTTSNFSKGIKDIVVNKEIDDKTLEEIEEFLIQSDVGVEASSEIRQQIANSRIDPSKIHFLYFFETSLIFFKIGSLFISNEYLKSISLLLDIKEEVSGVIIKSDLFFIA